MRCCAFLARAIGYRSLADRREDLRGRLRDLAGARPSYGYRRLGLLLSREGWEANHKLVFRLYREEGLGLRRRRPRRRVSAARRVKLAVAQQTNETWSMDFMADQLYSGRWIRILTLMDNYSRECLTLRVGVSLKGDDVVEALNQVIRLRGAPRSIRVDNGTEFTSVAMDQWAYWNGVTLDFSRPGKPQDNALIEAFNSRFRQECLNEHWFLSLADAQEKVDAWRNHYNVERPHSALGNLSPEDFVRASTVTDSAVEGKAELAVLT